MLKAHDKVLQSNPCFIPTVKKNVLYSLRCIFDTIKSHTR